MSTDDSSRHSRHVLVIRNAFGLNESLVQWPKTERRQEDDDRHHDV